MDAVDDSAATNFQEVYEKLQTGPWNSGFLGQKGAVVTEPLDTANPSNQDNVSRYTDKYLRHRMVGRTVDDFPFNPAFLPPELHKIVKLVPGSTETQSARPAKSSSKGKIEDRLAGMVGQIDEDNEKVPDEEGGDEEEGEEEVEDEFEEMDDDDYNAEKYFDDGDDYGDGDDGDNEAAY